FNPAPGAGAQGVVRATLYPICTGPGLISTTPRAVWHRLGLAPPDRASSWAPPLTTPSVDLVQLGVQRGGW
ncbi:MAG TPA: hypothetical protein VLL08_15135, partial [Kineosporiaceae bacterium]|nr:hypothetical protein [Kineosporiaceae bacterium]